MDYDEFMRLFRRRDIGIQCDTIDERADVIRYFLSIGFREESGMDYVHVALETKNWEFQNVCYRDPYFGENMLSFYKGHNYLRREISAKQFFDIVDDGKRGMVARPIRELFG